MRLVHILGLVAILTMGCLGVIVIVTPLVNRCETERKLFMLPAGKVIIPMWLSVCVR